MKRKQNNSSILIWVTIGILIILQFLMTKNSFNQIGYEELAEAVRNPFWLQNGYMYDGISSNLGWYAVLIFLYNIFGFSLFLAKYYRLFLHLISLVALYYVLKRFFNSYWSVFLLVTIGISPTLLYLNTLQTSYGLDLQYGIILLYLLLSTTTDQKSKITYLKHAILGFFVAGILLSYPTFLLYLPAFAGYYLWKLGSNKKSPKAKPLLFFCSGFLLPFVLLFVFVQNREMLFFDPATGSGLLRGAGVVSFSLDNFFRNTSLLFVNLFDKSFGYYYELTQVEFSGLYPVLGIIAVFGLGIYFLRDTKLRRIILLSFLLVGLSFFLASLTVDKTPGIRRYTGLLFGFYLLYGTVLYELLRSRIKRNTRIFLLLLLGLVPLHHILVYPINLSHRSDQSRFKDATWLLNPQDYMIKLTSSLTAQDVELACADSKHMPTYCRYSEIYAALSGNCYWNHINCHVLKGYDPRVEKYIPLSIETWKSYYFPH